MVVMQSRRRRFARVFDRLQGAEGLFEQEEEA
jgi:hypothetical protein